MPAISVQHLIWLPWIDHCIQRCFTWVVHLLHASAIWPEGNELPPVIITAYLIQWQL